MHLYENKTLDKNKNINLIVYLSTNLLVFWACTCNFFSTARISCFLFGLIIIKQILWKLLYVILIPQFQKRSFADGQFLGGTLNILNFRKIPKISPYMYKPLQI